MDDATLQRFLAQIPPVDRGDDPERDADSQPSEAWEALAARLGVPCPPELPVLHEEARRRAIFAAQWELLNPASALQCHESLVDLARTAPCLDPFARMLPIFTADGDLLLLAADGAVRRCSLDSGALFEDYGAVAPSFLALLDGMAEGKALPALWSPRGGRSAEELDARRWQWVDDIEYQVAVGHGHYHRADAWTCVTSMIVDLAPHYLRYPDGPDRRPFDGHVERARAPFTVEFEGDPDVVPRAVPPHVVLCGDRAIDLRAEAARFIRVALARGWTGRDARRLVLDGWAELGLQRPARVTTV